MTLLQGHKDPVLPTLIKVSNHMIMYNYAMVTIDMVTKR